MRSPAHRLGALWLGLLLQVFTFSGFLHPCCLLGGGGAMSVHAGAPVESHGDAAHLHGASDDGAGEGHSSGDPHGYASADAAGGHTHGSGSTDDCPDCDGVCGLCCQRPGAALAPTAGHAGAILDAPTFFAAGSEAGDALLPPTPAFLLPFANGPPLSPVATA